MSSLYKMLPSVDACALFLQSRFPDSAQEILLDHSRTFLAMLRNGIREGRIKSHDQLDRALILEQAAMFHSAKQASLLRHVVNGTGVVVHTNMGRSSLAEDACQSVLLASRGYCNLELDLGSGERGRRGNAVEDILCTLTGAEAALVVNNNAAAVLLMLDTLCKGGEVILSRGQLVEIGGDFRIPDVMERSGAALREVGATNRTHLRDYESTINENTRAILWVHPSNYRIIGFHCSASPGELASLAHEHGLPFLEDLGSGSLIDFSPWGLKDEPTVQEVLHAGADVVTFSGDKVLGGPQAGILAGKKAFIDAMRKNPLMRALRCCKLTYAALETTLSLYLDGEKAKLSIPTVRRLCMDADELSRRARELADMLNRSLSGSVSCSLHSGFSRVGGGAFPEQGLPTTLVRIAPLSCSSMELKRRLLSTDPPVMGRLEDGSFELDPRTIEDSEFIDVQRACEQALRHEDRDRKRSRTKGASQGVSG